MIRLTDRILKICKGRIGMLAPFHSQRMKNIERKNPPSNIPMTGELSQGSVTPPSDNGTYQISFNVNV
jgi:hypothetical protein